MARALSPTDLKRLHRRWRQRSQHRLGIGLDGVQGPFNVGAVIRTAAAYRCESLWLTESATGPDNPKVGKTALGTDRFMTATRVPTGSEMVGELHGRGFMVIAIELADTSKPLFELDLARDVCFIVGNEDHGCSSATLDAADEIAYLPQFGKVGSLNVATAASIAMYEWARQNVE